MTMSAPFGERDPRLGPIPVPAANAPKGMQPGDRAGLSNGATARVMSVSDEKVVIDANHLYAGEDLTLTVTLLEPPNGRPLQEATFAGGCFWGVELAYQREPGVVRTEVGYAQGADPSPSYEAVCSGVTGHTEAVRVRYDPARVSYERLCDLLLDRLGENRYALNRVGNDQGTPWPARLEALIGIEVMNYGESGRTAIDDDKPMLNSETYEDFTLDVLECGFDAVIVKSGVQASTRVEEKPPRH